MLIRSDSRPTVYECALMSHQAYEGHKLAIGMTLPAKTDWKIEDILSCWDDSFVIIYVHHERNQVVAAYKGISDVNSAKKELIDIFLYPLNPSQKHIRTAFETAEQVKQIALARKAQLTFTGHSLGAYLAELSVFYVQMYLAEGFISEGYDIRRYVSAITFESFGAQDIIEALQSSALKKQDLNELDIIEYLYHPNFINTCNRHIGTVYSFAPTINEPLLLDRLRADILLSFHPMDHIVNLLSNDQNQPVRHYMQEWPSMRHLRQDFFELAMADGKNQEKIKKDNRLFKERFATEMTGHCVCDDVLNQWNILPIRHVSLYLKNWLTIFYGMLSLCNEQQLQTLKQARLGVSIESNILEYLVSCQLLKHNLNKNIAYLKIFNQKSNSSESITVERFIEKLSTWLSDKTSQNEAIKFLSQMDFVSGKFKNKIDIKTLESESIVLAAEIPLDTDEMRIQKNQQDTRQFINDIIQAGLQIRTSGIENSSKIEGSIKNIDVVDINSSPVKFKQKISSSFSLTSEIPLDTDEMSIPKYQQAAPRQFMSDIIQADLQIRASSIKKGSKAEGVIKIIDVGDINFSPVKFKQETSSGLSSSFFKKDQSIGRDIPKKIVKSSTSHAIVPSYASLSHKADKIFSKASLEHVGRVCVLAVFPDGRLASAGYGGIKIWDIESKVCIATLPGHAVWISALAILPNERLVSAGYDKIKIWDIESKMCIATLSGHTDSVCALTILPNGRLASAGDDGTIKVWDVESKMCIATLLGHTGSVRDLTTLPNERLASAGDDTTIKIWDIESKMCIATFSGHTRSVCALAILPNGRLASASDDKTIKIWEVENKTCVAMLSGHENCVIALATLPSGQIASGSYDKTVRVWDWKNGRCEDVFLGHKAPVEALVVLADGRLASNLETGIGIWMGDVERRFEANLTLDCQFNYEQISSVQKKQSEFGFFTQQKMQGKEIGNEILSEKYKTNLTENSKILSAFQAKLEDMNKEGISESTKVYNAIINIVENSHDCGEDYKEKYNNYIFRLKLLKNSEENNELVKNIIQKLEIFFNQVGRERFSYKEFPDEKSRITVAVPKINLSQVSPEIAIFYLDTLSQFLGSFSFARRDYIGIHINFPEINQSHVSTEVVQSYIESLGMLRGLEIFGRHKHLQHFSLSLHLPSIDLSQVPAETVKSYVERLGGLGGLGMFGMHEHLQHFSLSLHLPNIDLSQVPAETAKSYVKRLGELGELGRLGMLGMHGPLQHFSLSLQLPSVDLSQVSTETATSYVERLGRLGRLGGLGMHGERGPLQHFSLSLQLPSIDLSQVSTETATSYVERLGSLGRFEDLRERDSLQHFSLSLQLPSIDFSRVSEEIAISYLENLNKMGEFKKFINNKNAIQLDLTHLHIGNATEPIVNHLSETLIKFSNLFCFSIIMNRSEVNYLKDNGISVPLNVVYPNISTENLILFQQIMQDHDEEAINILIDNNALNLQDPLSGSTILHLCMWKLAILIGKLDSNIIKEEFFQDEFIYFYHIINKIIDNNHETIFIKNNSNHLPIQIIADFFPMIRNKDNIELHIDKIFSCVQRCNTKSEESQRALLIIENKFIGKYPNILLKSSKNYVFWQGHQDVEDENIDKDLLGLSQNINKLKEKFSRELR